MLLAVLSICALLSLVACERGGVNFVMNRHIGENYCGQLHCQADFTYSGGDIASLVEMSIYDITRDRTGRKLTSVSTSHPDLFVDTAKSNSINSRGTISRHKAVLTVDLHDNSDCVYGVYKCQLNLITMTGQSEVLTQIYQPEQTNDCSRIAALQETCLTRLENATQRIAQLEALLNASTHKQQVPGSPCYKGMPSTTSRQEFLLWGRVPALCDTETDGGGWVVIQRRNKGAVEFYRGWADYTNGFGTPDTEFWIGLEVIHDLTSQGYKELRFDLQVNGRNYYAHYTNFTVGDHFSKYQLSVGEYDGTAGDSFSYHNGQKFSTYDNDNDISVRNSAFMCHGAWWFVEFCLQSNLNGQWNEQSGHADIWRALPAYNKVLDSTEMKVRQV